MEDVDLHELFRGTLPVTLPCGEGSTPEISPEQLEALRLAHAGLPVPANGGRCSGVPHGDTRLRGYVTVDNVVECIAKGRVFPSDPGYFGAGGVASNENALAGHYTVQSRKPKVAEWERLVAIEASETTFGLCEALGVEGWYPEGQGILVSFDDFENASEVTGSPFPAETNRVVLGGPALPIAEARGWLYLELSHPGGGSRQSHVTVRLRQCGASLRGLVEGVALSEPCGSAPTLAGPIPEPAPELQRAP